MADEATERITILLQAKDRDFQRAIDRNNKLIARFERDTNRSTSSMARGMNKNLAAASSSVLSLGKSFAIGLAGGVIGAAFAGVTGNIRAVIGEIADLNDAADRIGLGVEELQGLQAGFKLAGVEVDETSKALEIFSQRIGEAADGEGALFGVLEKSNIAIRDQAGNVRPTIDLLRDYAGAMDGAGSGQERLAMAADAFGKSGRAMVLGLEGGAGSVDALIENARAAGLVMDEELVQKAAELDDKFDVLTMKLGVLFKGAVVGAAEFFTSSATAADILIAKFGTIEQAAAKMGAPAVDEFVAGTADEADSGIGEYEQAMVAADAAAADLAMQAQDVAYQLLETAAAMNSLGETDAAAALIQLSQRMDSVVENFNSGASNASVFSAELGVVKSQAESIIVPLENIDGASFGGVIANLGTLGGALEAVRNIAVAAMSAVTALAPILVSAGPGQTTSTPISGSIDNLMPPTVQTVTTSPRPQAAPNNIDFGLPDAGSVGGSSGGASSAGNELLREAEQLYEATRTEAEKYATELENLNELQRLGYIDTETYGRAVEKLGEQYGQAGGMSSEFKGQILDLVDGTLSAADAFDQLRREIIRAAAEYLLFGSNPLAAGGSMEGSLLGGIASIFDSFDGGGYTGSGARSGGLDGKGGYMAMVHPQETVIDHTKGGSVSGSPVGGVVEVLVAMDGDANLVPIIKRVSGQVVAQARPSIVSQSVSSTEQAMRKTKSFGGRG